MNNRLLLRRTQKVNPDNLIITVKTDESGASNNNQFILSLSGTYDVLNWGDGTSSLGVSANQTHTYATSGIYNITISNTFDSYRFNLGGDGDKLIDVKQFGTAQLTTFQSAFADCNNITVFSAVDVPDLSNVIDMPTAFFNASNFNQNINNWDVSNVQSMQRLFFNADGFNQPLNNWDVSNVTDMSVMFRFNNGFNQDISDWNIANVSDFENFLEGQTGTFSTQNYNLLLVGWEQTLQNAYPGGVGYPHTISIGFGGTKYTLGGAAETARTSLINNFGWTISDGGGI